LNKKRHHRPADVLYEFITTVLYEPIKFSVCENHFQLLGDGCKALSVHFNWLDTEDKLFLQKNVFANGKSYFDTCIIGENNHIRFDKFKHNPPGMILSPVDKSVNISDSHTSIFSFVWQREIVRDFVWLILHKAQKEGEPVLKNELILALSKINQEHPYGSRDLFISALFQGVCGQLNIHQVQCWGFSSVDIHPEDAYQRQKFKEITTTIY